MGVEGQGASQQPYETPMAILGRAGLQLNKPLDQYAPEELSRFTNLFHTGSDLQTRPGQTLLCTGLAGQTAHSVRRLNDPKNATFTRFWGIGSQLLRGTSGALSSIAAGFSGNPLTFCEARPPQSGEPWMLVADGTKLVKASRTSAALPIGLPAPASLLVGALPGRFRGVAGFDAVDGTQAAAWTPVAGFDANGNQAAVPLLTDIPGTNGNGVNMGVTFGNAGDAYYSVMALPRALDLSIFDDGAATADDDIIHLAIRLDIPSNVEEIRFYFVVSPFATGGPSPIVPGTSSTQNLAAYLHVYRPSDYATFIAGDATAAEAQESIRQAQLLENYREDAALSGDTVTTTNLPGAHTWTEFGIVDLPVRRGDFLKVGSAGQVGTTWATVTGLYIVVRTTGKVSVNVAFDDCYVVGGYGPDSSEPGSSPYDYRATNFDPRTGAESNGTAIQPGVDLVRSRGSLTPAAYGDPNVRQIFYRRGGTITDNWYDVGTNAADGGAFIDTLSDADIVTGTTLPTDHFQPVATVTALGVTVLAQPVPVILGPLEDGTFLALGDPNRPGHLYASLPGEPDHWPSTGNFAIEVCPPSEELMNGVVISGQGFVFSRERGYPVHASLTGGEGIVAQAASITPGLATRWGITAGPGGIYYVARDGVRTTTGSGSEILSDAIRPLFQWDPGGSTAAVVVNGYAPIDWNHPESVWLTVHNLDLWLGYQDTLGVRHCLIYSLIYRYWRDATFARAVTAADSDPTFGGLRLILGSTTGNGYTHEGTTDDGVVISWQARTGALDLGRPREEKQLADLVLDADLNGVTLALQTFLNTETITNNPQTVAGVIGRRRYTFEPFGTTPQHARTVSVDLTGAGVVTGLGRLGVSFVPEPDVTMNRATTWEAVGNGTTEGYLIGCLLDCDTGGTARTIVIEGDLAGAFTTIATLQVTSTGRHKLWFSWPAVHVEAVRLRPNDACEPWMLWRVEWLAQAEPPRIAGWDTNWELQGESRDRYYTGVDLECDTFGATKTVQFYVDQVLVDTQQVTAAGRTLVHITLTPGRGHLFRFVATDANPGLLYSHAWLTVPEPEEQTHWNAAFTTWSSLSDKYLKGVILELDSFGQTKTVNIEADGAVVGTFTVSTSGRLVRHIAFPQVLGRVFRIIPTDAFRSRLYTAQPIFDEEPFALNRWETQQVDHGLPVAGWGTILSADICLKSTAVVTWAVSVYNAAGTLIQTLTQVIPSTGGAKQKRFAPVSAANKGVLFKHVFTSADGSALTLYQEESRIRIAPWGSPQLAIERPLFGNADLDPTRNMVSAVYAAGRGGGQA